MAEITTPQDRPWLTDFATLFAHMWYRDFPLQRSWRDKAQRADWTTHIGLSVRSAADLMGLFTHFESGGRTDAVLKDNRRNTIAALEWEWSALHRGDKIVTEFEKLKKTCGAFPDIRFACLIGYARSGTSPRSRDDYTQRTATVLDSYATRWTQGLPPLLLVVVYFEWKGNEKGRQFVRMSFDQLSEEHRTPLREQPAYPWEVIGSRWEQETGSGL